MHGLWFMTQSIIFLLFPADTEAAGGHECTNVSEHEWRNVGRYECGTNKSCDVGWRSDPADGSWGWSRSHWAASVCSGWSIKLLLTYLTDVWNVWCTDTFCGVAHIVYHLLLMQEWLINPWPKIGEGLAELYSLYCIAFICRKWVTKQCSMLPPMSDLILFYPQPQTYQSITSCSSLSLFHEFLSMLFQPPCQMCTLSVVPMWSVCNICKYNYFIVSSFITHETFLFFFTSLLTWAFHKWLQGTLLSLSSLWWWLLALYSQQLVVFYNNIRIHINVFV